MASIPAVGAELPVFARSTGFPYWNRYAAVNDEFIDIHMDDEAGRAAGYPTAFGMGNLTWAYLHVALHTWFGDDARIDAVATQFRAAVTRGTELRVRGRVTSVEPGPGGGATVAVDIWAENGDGARLAPGSATVILPARAGG